MGILQFFTNSFDLIWRPKLKVIKKRNKKNRTSPSRPNFSPLLALRGLAAAAQHDHGRSVPSIVPGNLLFPSFSNPFLFKFLYLHEFNSEFDSVCFYLFLLQVEPFHRPKPLYKHLGPQPFDFFFSFSRTPKLSNLISLFSTSKLRRLISAPSSKL